MIRTEIAQNLHRLHLRGNIIGGVVNIVVATVATFYPGEIFFTHSHWPHAYVIILLGALLRVGSSFLTKNLSQISGTMGSALLGIGWGYYFCVITSVFGLESVETSYTLLVLAGVVNAAGTSYRANQIQYALFITILAIIISFRYLISAETSNWYMVLYVVSFYLLNLFTFRISHKQLLRSVEGEVMAKYEKERFNRLINAVPGYVAILNKDLVYLDANKLTLSLEPHLIGTTLGGGKTASEYIEFIRGFAQSQKELDTQEVSTDYRGVRKSFLISIQRTKEGGYVVVSIPMDELVTTRQELRVQEAKAVYSAKLASLGEMAASIAHEVNNPLTIIQGSASIIQELVDKEPMDKENIKFLTSKMVETTERISKTIKSLKALSRSGENDSLRVVSLRKIIGECLDICRHRFVQNAIELRLPDFKTDVLFQGREIQIGQVILNLLGNALDALNGYEKDERWIEIRVTRKDASLSIDIIDSGPGVPESIRNKIMEPFFTTKDIGQGTGLGLSISKTLINEHGGELLYLPEMNNTTFRIYLPNASV